MKAPHTHSGARRRFVRRDAAALAKICASRAINATQRPFKGARYVVGDEEYELWAIRPGVGVVFRSVKRPNAFLVEECSGPFNPANFA